MRRRRIHSVVKVHHVNSEALEMRKIIHKDAILERIQRKFVKQKLPKPIDQSQPPVLVLKRVAVRTLPDGRSVSFYRDDKTKIVIMYPPSFTWWFQEKRKQICDTENFQLFDLSEFPNQWTSILKLFQHERREPPPILFEKLWANFSTARSSIEEYSDMKEKELSKIIANRTSKIYTIDANNRPEISRVTVDNVTREAKRLITAKKNFTIIIVL